MAVTAIWPIKGRVDKVINYARNPEKTTEAGLPELASLHTVNDLVEYAADEMKTECRSYPTAITQNVEYLLDSVQASTMLSNSEFIVMLNQAAGDREKLAHLLNISEEQMSYITNADAGCGLIKYGSALVPFVNRFPDNTELYRLMTTRPGEGRFSGGRA